MGKIDFWRGSGRGMASSGPASPYKAAEALLLLHSFEESRQGWFWSTDHAGRVTYLSAGISQSLGFEKDAALECGFTDLFVPAEDDMSGRGKLPFIFAKQSPFQRIIVHAVGSADERCWSVSGIPQFDQAGRFTGFRGSGLDITEQRQSSHRASQLAKYDALTGLPNRLSMAESLQGALSGQPARPCTLMLVDLDRFKQVNDTLGHPAGDALLKQVAERLLKIVGDREKVFRLGGDEFQILLQGDDRGIVGDVAAEIIASLSQPYSVDGQRCIIGASIGIAAAPADGSTPEELVRNADLALYASKTGGRGRFRFFSGELLEAAEDKRLLEEDLRDALARGEIYVEYQPIIDAKTNFVKGVEALIRWRHPTRGQIPPSLFIPIAEEADLIGPLGEWVLRKACEDASKWPTKLRVAVNVSPLQFANEALPEIILSALAASGLAPDRLELEITEGVFLAESAETDTMFVRLKEIGVRLALDDFGTGYSSLSYLRTAPFDKIKIDQTFVRAATLPGCRNSAIIAAIVALADALGMETTAEGIEFMDQLHLIRGLGVSHVQGYVYSSAISGEELKRRLEAGDWIIEPSGPARQRSERQAMYRKVGVMHDGRYEPALIRNLSESGALLDGPSLARPGSLCIVDFGDGQLSFARVTRAAGRQQGIAFEQQLVNDGNGGLCTPHRVSPYLLATMGMPSVDKAEEPSEISSNLLPLEELGKKLGLRLAPALAQPAALNGANIPLTFGGRADVGTGMVGVQGAIDRRHDGEGGLSRADAESLIEAARSSPNRQLKYVVGLLILTGARPGELLRAQWSQIDFEAAVWHMPIAGGGKARELRLEQATLDLLGELPRWEGCPYLIANPTTKKPYHSLAKSWDAIRVKAGLPYLELDDLRYCHVDTLLDPGTLLSLSQRTPGDAETASPAPADSQGEGGPSLPAWLSRQPQTA